jgi:hypothetical protein
MSAGMESMSTLRLRTRPRSLFSLRTAFFDGLVTRVGLADAVEEFCLPLPLASGMRDCRGTRDRHLTGSTRGANRCQQGCSRSSCGIRRSPRKRRKAATGFWSLRSVIEKALLLVMIRYSVCTDTFSSVLLLFPSSSDFGAHIRKLAPSRICLMPITVLLPRSGKCSFKDS